MEIQVPLVAESSSKRSTAIKVSDAKVTYDLIQAALADTHQKASTLSKETNPQVVKVYLQLKERADTLEAVAKALEGNFIDLKSM